MYVLPGEINLIDNGDHHLHTVAIDTTVIMIFFVHPETIYDRNIETVL